MPPSVYPDRLILPIEAQIRLGLEAFGSEPASAYRVGMCSPPPEIAFSRLPARHMPMNAMLPLHRAFAPAVCCGPPSGDIT